MDRATQANLPTIKHHHENNRKNLQRYNTISSEPSYGSPRGDLRGTQGLQTNIAPSVWINDPSGIPHFKLQADSRPLSVSNNNWQKSRSSDYLTTRLSYSPNELLGTLSLITNERTPLHSPNSSVIGIEPSSNKHQYHSVGSLRPSPSNSRLPSQHLLRVASLPSEGPHSNNSMGCRCFYETADSNLKSRIPITTPESLSWRRLHMSRAKLKATSTTSELLSGFAMVAMVELQINEDTAVPEWLFVMFSVCTTVLVAVHIFALMISTYILPNIDAISKLDVCELVTESPHERMKGFIELAWAFSTVLELSLCFRVGLFLFLVEVAILCWVKFWDYSFTAAIAATVIVIPVLVVFVLFAVHFYHSLVVDKCNSSTTDMEKLEDMKKHLDLATTPV